MTGLLIILFDIAVVIAAVLVWISDARAKRNRRLNENPLGIKFDRDKRTYPLWFWEKLGVKK